MSVQRRTQAHRAKSVEVHMQRWGSGRLSASGLACGADAGLVGHGGRPGLRRAREAARARRAGVPQRHRHGGRRGVRGRRLLDGQRDPDRRTERRHHRRHHQQGRRCAGGEGGVREDLERAGARHHLHALASRSHRRRQRVCRCRSARDLQPPAVHGPRARSGPRGPRRRGSVRLDPARGVVHQRRNRHRVRASLGTRRDEDWSAAADEDRSAAIVWP